MAIEKYVVNDCGEKIIKGRLWTAKSRKNALATYPAIIVLL